MTTTTKQAKNMITRNFFSTITNPNTLAGCLRTACAVTLLLLFTLPAVVQAQDYTYTTNADNTITITGYTGDGGDVVIPDTINSLPVISIGNAAFWFCTSLTSVTIPNSVTSIGADAFYYCFGMSNVMIGNSITNIGDSAFFDCSSLTAITVDTNNPTFSSVDGVLFDKSQTTLLVCPCGKAESYTVPNGVASVGSEAFMNCASLTSVTIPNSVTAIGFGAFTGCYGLVSVTIGNSVTSIGGMAFYWCTSLTEVYFQGNAPNLGQDVFFGNNNAIVYYLPGTTGWDAPTFGGLPTAPWPFPDFLYLDNNGMITITGYTGSGGDVILPDTINGLPVTSIGASAFSECTSLTSVTIPNSITNIGFGAFGNCTSLTSVTIPNSVTSIGDAAFCFCTSLAGIYFQGNDPGIGSDVFDGDNDVTLYYLPGMTGWNTTFDVPTALWNPQAQTGDGGFGVQNNCFGFNITGTSGIEVVVEACNLPITDSAWFPVGTNALIGGSSYFSDPDWMNQPGRFYRLRSP